MFSWYLHRSTTCHTVHALNILLEMMGCGSKIKFTLEGRTFILILLLSIELGQWRNWTRGTSSPQKKWRTPIWCTWFRRSLTNTTTGPSSSLPTRASKKPMQKTPTWIFGKQFTSDMEMKFLQLCSVVIEVAVFVLLLKPVYDFSEIAKFLQWCYKNSTFQPSRCTQWWNRWDNHFMPDVCNQQMPGRGFFLSNLVFRKGFNFGRIMATERSLPVN